MGNEIFKYILISPKNRTAYNFRGDLLKEIVVKGYEVIVTGPNEDNVDKIEALGARFKLIPLDKAGLNLAGDIKYFYKLWRFLKKEKPAITLGYTIKPVIYGAIAARLAGVKNINSMVTGVGYVYTVDTFKAKVLKSLVSLLYRLGFKCAHTVIFQNKDNLNEFTELKLLKPDKCCLVNGSGINMELFKPAPYPERLTFFMLSRVMYSKGIREYLQAAKVVKSRYPEVRFMLLGAVENLQDSMQMKDLNPYIEEGIIDYYGEVNDVRPYYEQCSVYVLPSYREGTPRTVLEAMAMARPIITTDAPGCRETVIDGVSGFLVPVCNSAAVAEKMEWFIDHQEQIKKMGQESLKLCKDKYDVNKVNQAMLVHMNI